MGGDVQSCIVCAETRGMSASAEGILVLGVPYLPKPGLKFRGNRIHRRKCVRTFGFAHSM